MTVRDRGRPDRECAMASHKFQVGEIVNLRPIVSRNVPGGAYEVTKHLPHSGREFEYRIKSASEEHERVVGETTLPGHRVRRVRHAGTPVVVRSRAPSLPQLPFWRLGFCCDTRLA